MKDKLSFLTPGGLDPIRPSGAGPSPTEGERKKVKEKKAYSGKKDKDQSRKKGRPDQGRIDVEA
jgi:hypothetical protein